MDDNKIFITWRPKRSITLDFLLIVLLAVSIMCMPACSSDSDNAAVQPNYIVQATVSVEEDGPIAYALVMDGDQNLVSTLNLTINGDPMNIEYSADANVEIEVSDDGSSYYTLELSELKGGDMVVFEAVDQWGEIVYAPEPAVIPMTIELLDPQEDTEVVAGDEVIIRWTGGEGATSFSVAYAALDGSALFWDNLESTEAGAYTVPAGQTVEGSAIVGVGAITGDTAVIGTLDSEFNTDASYFLVSREVGNKIMVRAEVEATYDDDHARQCRAGTGVGNALGLCQLQFAALGIGAIVWETRRQMDLKIEGNKPCASWTGGALDYCKTYGAAFGYLHWGTNCLACVGNRDYRKCLRSCIGYTYDGLCLGWKTYCRCDPSQLYGSPRWAEGRKYLCEEDPEVSMHCRKPYIYCPIGYVD